MENWNKNVVLESSAHGTILE